ncbi:MAG: hypothetical protein ABJA66_01180 [Actinomycetota bacterium]
MQNNSAALQKALAYLKARNAEIDEPYALALYGLASFDAGNAEEAKAVMDADWSLSRYDVLPDRIVLYMWSKAGGTKFNFKLNRATASTRKRPRQPFRIITTKKPKRRFRR